MIQDPKSRFAHTHYTLQTLLRAFRNDIDSE